MRPAIGLVNTKTNCIQMRHVKKKPGTFCLDKYYQAIAIILFFFFFFLHIMFIFHGHLAYIQASIKRETADHILCIIMHIIITNKNYDTEFAY